MVHTPGPWTVVQTTTAEVESVIASPFTVRAPLGYVPHGLMGDYRGEIVAEIQQNGSDPLNGMAEANAHLIAAAPSLLIAARAIRKSCPCDPDITREFNAAWGLLEAAIRQAEVSS